jgi:streptogramin lyase
LSKLPSLDIVVDRATNSVVLSWNHLLSGPVLLEHSLDTVTWNALSPNNATGNFRHELGNALKGFYRLKPVKSVPPEVAPTAVRDFAATATGVGTLTASWNAPATGNATSYTVTMTTLTGSGSSTQTQVTTDPSVTYTGLSPANSYAFSVTASNAVGTSVAAQASFGQAPIAFPQPQALTTGLDGSIWVGSAFGIAPDGEQGLVTQIVKQNGVWTAQPAIPALPNIYDLAATPDGSIWMANYGYNSIFQLVNTNGVWDYKPGFFVVSPTYFTVGLDGSLWVSSFIAQSVLQFVNIGETSWELKEDLLVGKFPVGLTTGLDGSIWVAHDKQIDPISKVNGVWTSLPGFKFPLTTFGVTTGADGSIWVTNDNMVTQMVNKNGAWDFGPDITVGPSPRAVVTGLDGSIWVMDSSNNTVQQIVNKNGAWRALPGFAVGASAQTLTLGLDGSLWVANMASNNVQQIVGPPPTGPSNLAAVFGPAAGQMTLGWQPPSANGGSPAFSYTATVSQGDFFQTIKTTSTSVVFDGLTLGAGPTYFTVSSANFAGVGALVGHQIDAAGNTIPQQPYTAPGISTDGTSFATNGLDDNGYAYSWQAMGNAATGGMRVGSLLAWNGVTFNLAVPNQPNSFWAAAQTINVAQGGYNTLNLAGAGVNGSQQNQPIRLNFTDGSSVVWTQSFSDWGSPQNYGHEAIVSTQSYRNTSTGGTNQFTNHIYGYSYSIPVGKTLASITLPYNTNVRLLDVQMSNSTPVNLSGAYTSWGIANGNTQVANRQGFDGGGYYYYSGNLQSTVSWSGATFNFGPVPNSNNGQNNFVQAKGQTISLPQGDYGWLYLAGAAANGSQQNQQITLTFTDGTTDGWTQSFSDWTGPQNYAKEAIIQKQSERVNQVGNVHSETNYVYGYAYQIPAGKTIASIKLPNNENVGILGMTMLNR